MLITQQISCLDYYKQCFAQNALGAGQCCECLEGYGGLYCDIPLCKKCVHGKCSKKDTCSCFKNYQGEYCDERTINKFLNII
jgi:hypothetical protein